MDGGQPDPRGDGIAARAPPGRADRPSETDLKQGIIHTRVTRPVAWSMAAAFLALIASVPVAQAVAEWRRGGAVQAVDVYRRAPTQSALHRYEDELERASIPRSWSRPRVQAVLTGRLGFGSDTVVAGRGAGWRANGWLFYGPGVRYVAGPGFLDPRLQSQRRKAALDEGEPEVHPDPRPAVLDFHRALAARGVRLVLLPVPDKTTLQSAQLAGRRFAARGPAAAPNNADFARFVAELRGQGVDVFDPTPAAFGPDDPPRFLSQDTHWSPAWMRRVAGALADHLRAADGSGPPAQGGRWKVRAAEVSRVGDLVDLLGLPPGQALYAPQAVAVEQVTDPLGSPWQPRADADVLLLGDSFCNVFSAGEMGWGDSAGFAEHLSLALGRDVDLIARNDNGAYATRAMLARELAAGRDRLAGKRVAVWEFAARELAVGDWRPVALRVGTPTGRRFIVPAGGAEMVVSGTVAARSPVGRPGMTPYADQVMAVHLVDIAGPDGPVPGGEAVVYLYGMRDRAWTDAGRLRVGQRVTVRLTNWADVAGKLVRVARSELDDPELLAAETAWGELVTR